MSNLASAIYVGKMTHTRRGPQRHRFGYRLHMFYLDLEEIDEVDRVLPRALLRRGRFGWLSFQRSDYLTFPYVGRTFRFRVKLRRTAEALAEAVRSAGPEGPAYVPIKPLKQSVLDLVEARLGRRPAGPVRVLTQVRCFGYVFNPVSFYYCFAADGTTLEAIVAEITNTPWQERHAYVLAADAGFVRASFPKAFHVSPFFDMAQRYKWLVTTPGDELVVTMVNQKDGQDVFSATLALERKEMTAAAIWSVALRQPLMAWRVHLGIYIQAFRLWRKGTPYVEHPSTRPTADLRRGETWKV